MPLANDDFQTYTVVPRPKDTLRAALLATFGDQTHALAIPCDRSNRARLRSILQHYALAAHARLVTTVDGGQLFAWLEPRPSATVLDMKPSPDAPATPTAVPEGG